MSHGKQIRLFLTDGSASGIRYAELMNWTGQAFACPKVHFSGLQKWPETQRSGVYVLIGVNKDGDDAVYIGESENVAKRLLQHVSKSTLDDIVSAFLFTSKDDNLTKGHITFLEQRLIKRAEEAKQYPVECGREPSEKLLSKPEVATMEEFLENLYLVSAALGFSLFEIPPSAPPMHVAQPQDNQEEANPNQFSFVMDSGLKAQGFQSDEGFVVTNGSEAVMEDAESLQAGYKALKDSLKKNGVLLEDNGKHKFTQDYTFKSASAAVSVVAGSQRSGPKSWKNAANKTLGEVEAEKATEIEATIPQTPEEAPIEVAVPAPQKQAAAEVAVVPLKN